MTMLGRVCLLVRARVSSVLDRAQDPRETLDFAYAQQQELLRQVRQGVIEVATSKSLLQHQARRLRDQVPHCEQQAALALAAGREDLARIALERKQAALSALGELEVRLAEVAAEEQRLGQAEQQVATSVDEFRLRRATLGARYTAAEAQTRVMESLTGVSREFAQLGAAIGRAEERIDHMRARAAAIDALIDSGSLVGPGTALDPLERELRQLSTNEAVEHELSALRRAQSPNALELPAADGPAGRRANPEAT